MAKRLIISPSGGYYGSEQVLHDYLTITKVKSDVLIPKNSLLLKKVKNNTYINIIPYNIAYLPFTYLWVFFKILTNKYNTIYINESGHIKYLVALSFIFKKIKFIAHIRILEDTNIERWPRILNKNIILISISEFIRNALSFKSILLYDLYKFDKKNSSPKLTSKSTINIAVIGRISESKGLNFLLEILKFIQTQKIENELVFNLFGTKSFNVKDELIYNELKHFKNVIFHGFQENKQEIYDNNDCVLHCNPSEPLGRIFLESINYLKPLVGFNEGGIGEIGRLVALDDYLFNPYNETYKHKMLELFINIKYDSTKHSNNMIHAKNLAQKIFSESNYCNVLDNLNDESSLYRPF